ncbi:MAG: xanthine dehydrogenase small subunit [Deltaproteobacteria bacterium]|nr:xanthine dehydrogenase small subunit [Deltaproteobacteria bacterium]
MDVIRFTLNGQSVEERGIAPTTTLLNYLRHRGLTGTKEGCAEGDCGACTVALLEEAPDGTGRWRAVNSCLVLLPMLQGREVVTVEGIADGDRAHPAQTAMVQNLGSQCGYCTPGVVMSLFEATYRSDLDEAWKLDDQMCGNLCRCTGYRPIRDAAKAVAGTRPRDRFLERAAVRAGQGMKLAYAAGVQRYFNPVSVGELCELLDTHPEARIVSGGTDLCLEVTKKRRELPLLISVEGVPELRRMERRPEALVLGAAASLSDVEAFTRESCPPLHRMLRYFASRQIKNRGTLGGNVCNASPIGDTPPVLLALGASVTLRRSSGTRTVPLDAFFLDYRKTALQAGEFLESVTIPSIPAGARAAAYKVSRRRELDISAVAAGFFVVTDDAGRVTEARLAYGGMAAIPRRAAGAEAALRGQPWNEASVEKAVAALAKDFTPISDLRASAWYRATVAGNLLRGFHLETRDQHVPHLPQRPNATLHLQPSPGGQS